MPSHYGVKIRKKEEKVLQKMRLKHECLKCGKKSVRRQSTALWKCKSCGTEFAGGAYSPQTDIGITANKIILAMKK